MRYVGVLFFDHDEIIFHLYKKSAISFTLLAAQVHDLATFNPEKPVTSVDILTVVAERIFGVYALWSITWLAYAREIPEDTLEELRTTLHLDIPLLSLTHEQELLCTGILMEA